METRSRKKKRDFPPLSRYAGWPTMETRSRKKKRDIERSPFSELSDDLLVEIFSRVPFKSTRCCKCVCTRWRGLLSHPDHRKKLPWSTLAGFFYKTGNLCARKMNRHYKSFTRKWCRGIDPSLSFLPKYRLCDIHIDMLDCCNGLLLCRRQQKTGCYMPADYVVCNPATKRWVPVPGTDGWSNEVRVARLGFDPVVSSHFHVFEFVPTKNHKHIESLRIYSSKAGVWTHRSDWRCPININRHSHSAFFRGVLYLSSYYGDKVVVAIDMEGNYRVHRIPMSYGPFIRGVYVSQRQLHLAISSGSELSIWALEDSSSTGNWTLKHKISHLQLFGEEEDSSIPQDHHIIIHPEYNVMFILCTSRHSTCRSYTKLMSYDMDSRELHSMPDLGHDCKGPYLSYVPLFSHSLAHGH